MCRAIVVHVTTLAEGCEIAVGIVGGVVIAVGGRKDNLRRTHEAEILDRWHRSEWSSSPVTPCTDAGIPPASVAEMVDRLAMWPATPLTGPASPAKADRGRELRPVDGVEEAVLPPDRHARQSCRTAAAPAPAAWLRVRA